MNRVDTSDRATINFFNPPHFLSTIAAKTGHLKNHIINYLSNLELKNLDSYYVYVKNKIDLKIVLISACIIGVVSIVAKFYFYRDPPKNEFSGIHIFKDPRAIDKLPVLLAEQIVISKEAITIKEMSHSIMKGKTSDGRPFLAFDLEVCEEGRSMRQVKLILLENLDKKWKSYLQDVENNPFGLYFIRNYYNFACCRLTSLIENETFEISNQIFTFVKKINT